MTFLYALLSPYFHKHTGSRSLAGQSQRGSLQQLLGVESGFHGRPGQWRWALPGHMPGPMRHCSMGTRMLRPSVTLWLAAGSHIAHRWAREGMGSGFLHYFSAVRASPEKIVARRDILKSKPQGLTLDSTNLTWAPTQPLHFKFTK